MKEDTSEVQKPTYFAVRSLDRYIENRMKEISEMKTDAGNPKLVANFILESKINHKKDSTMIGYLKVIRDFTEFLGDKSFKGTTREDVANFLVQIENNPELRNRKDEKHHKRHKTLSSGTLVLYRHHLRYFLKWVWEMKGDKEYPECVKWIKVGTFKSKDVTSNEIYTTEEVKQMLQACQTPMEKALVSVLYESACRIGELLGLRISHINWDQYGAILHVDGKTGPRRVRIIHSVPELQSWLNHHPFINNKKDDKKEGEEDDPYVFLESSKRKGLINAVLSYNTAYDILRDIGRTAGIKKKVRPHLFRHTRITHMTKEGWDRQEIGIHVGWTKASPMANIYTHISFEDVDSKAIEKAGLKKKRSHNPIMLNTPCLHCGTVNPRDFHFCGNCNNPLDNTSQEYARKKKERDDFMTTCMANPDFMHTVEKLALVFKEMQIAKEVQPFKLDV